MLVTRARDNAVLPRVLQPRRRPGRARLRRPLGRARRRGRGRRARARVRGGAARRRRRPGRGGRPPAARRAAPRARPSAGRRARRRRVLDVPRPRREQSTPRAGEVRPSSRSSSRCGCALALGLRDYVEKNGFRDVVVGVSGGIDSALTAALCVDALGAGARPLRLDAVPLLVGGDARRRPRGGEEPRLPTSASSRSRASSTAFHEALGGLEGLAAENLQARIRGTMLMALSNTHGWLVVATGNKSELAVGYATLYGDMVGGYALLKDVFKTDVFRLARLPERAGRARADPRYRRSSGRRRPSCAPTSETTSRCRPTSARPACSRRTSSSTARARSCSSEFDAGDRSSGRSRSSTAPSTSAARRRPASSSARAPSVATGARRSRTAGAARRFSSRRQLPGTSAAAPAHGTAAFAGDVDGSTNRRVSPSRRSCSPCSGRSPNVPR